MSWSYDPTIPTDKDAVRLNIGDTDINDQLLQDEEIEHYLDEAASVLGASILCAEAIAGKFARGFNQRVGDLSADLSKRADAYWKLAEKYRKQLAIVSGAPLVPALSKSQKQSYREDTDRVQPNFAIGMNDDDSEVDPEDGAQWWP